jgi:hypothetical protein
MRLLADGVSGIDVAEPDNTDDVACIGFVHIVSAVGMHFEDATHSLGS